MKLENSFSVAAPLEETWRTLLDIERVATCLPGARLESGGEDGVFRGAMKMKLGPMTVDYRGSARLQDVDEDTHTASIAVNAREARGQGTAAAVIENRLTSENGRTTVTATTDLKITGRQAQFGRGIMEDVATTMMGEFAKRLEREIERDGTAPGEAKPVDAAPGSDEAEALDVGNVLLQTPAARNAGIAAAVALLLLLLIGLASRGGRAHRYTLNLNLRK